MSFNSYMHQSKYLPYKEINEESRPKKIKKINQYLFIDKLGVGYFSKVYLALNQDKKDESTEKSKNQELYYAAKAIHIHEDAQKSKTLEREIILLRLLDHPYIIKLYNVLYASSTDMAYLMMEFADCGTLEEAINNHVKLDEKTIASIFYQISLALLYLHSNRIVHRDVKPSNILLFSDGTAKISDLGISHFEESAESVCGTPLYQAPDLFEGVHSDLFEESEVSQSNNDDFDKKINILKENMINGKSISIAKSKSSNINCKDNNKNEKRKKNDQIYSNLNDDKVLNEWKIDPKKGDVWSLGISMYQAAYGVLPYDGRNVYEIVNNINNSPLVIPKIKGKQFSPLFVDLIKKMLEKKPSKRLSMIEVINHPFFIRFQLYLKDDQNELNPNIIINGKKFMKKCLFDIKPFKPQNYSGCQIENINAIICPDDYKFCKKSKRSIYSFYRYTFVDDNE